MILAGRIKLECEGFTLYLTIRVRTSSKEKKKIKFSSFLEGNLLEG
jgi:hypothetical protein